MLKRCTAQRYGSTPLLATAGPCCFLLPDSGFLTGYSIFLPVLLLVRCPSNHSLFHQIVHIHAYDNDKLTAANPILPSFDCTILVRYRAVFVVDWIHQPSCSYCTRTVIHRPFARLPSTSPVPLFPLPSSLVVNPVPLPVVRLVPGLRPWSSLRPSRSDCGPTSDRTDLQTSGFADCVHRRHLKQPTAQTGRSVRAVSTIVAAGRKGDQLVVGVSQSVVAVGRDRVCRADTPKTRDDRRKAKDVSGRSTLLPTKDKALTRSPTTDH